MVNDREILIGILNALGKLTETLTGNSILLCFKDTEGNLVHVYPDTEKVTYIILGAESQDGQTMEPPTMRCALHCAPDAIGQEPLRVVEQ